MVWSEKPHRVPLEVDVKYISWEPTGVGKPFKEKPESLRLGMEVGAKGVSKTQLKSNHSLVTELSFTATRCSLRSGQAFQGSVNANRVFLKNSRLRAGP